jgi:hypothetical protein
LASAMLAATERTWTLGLMVLTLASTPASFSALVATRTIALAPALANAGAIPYAERQLQHPVM